VTPSVRHVEAPHPGSSLTFVAASNRATAATMLLLGEKMAVLAGERRRRKIPPRAPAGQPGLGEIPVSAGGRTDDRGSRITLAMGTAPARRSSCNHRARGVGVGEACAELLRPVRGHSARSVLSCWQRRSRSRSRCHGSGVNALPAIAKRNIVPGRDCVIRVQVRLVQAPAMGPVRERY